MTRIGLSAAHAQPANGAGTVIESDRYRVEAALDGTLAVLDKRSGRRFEHVHVLEDEPDMGDLYNFCPVDQAQIWHSDHADVRVLADRPLVSELEVRVEAERPAALDADFRPLDETVPLRVVTVVRLVRGSSRVDSGLK